MPFILAADAAVEATIELAGATNIEGTVSMTTGKMIPETTTRACSATSS